MSISTERLGFKLAAQGIKPLSNQALNDMNVSQRTMLTGNRDTSPIEQLSDTLQNTGIEFSATPPESVATLNPGLKPEGPEFS